MMMLMFQMEKNEKTRWRQQKISRNNIYIYHYICEGRQVEKNLLNLNYIEIENVIVLSRKVLN